MRNTITSDRKAADPIGNNTGGGQASPAGNGAAAKPSDPRKDLLPLLVVAVLAAGAAYGAFYLEYGRFHETTDDAYVSGNLVQITPQVRHGRRHQYRRHADREDWRSGRQA